ncbi:MAG TPA: GDP-mannose 4,6-dehydratase [Vicinamibacterales bacterium]|nr:GDP-mannose 4,6-dehydratase [Vicinamibacterales bacterium]
MTGAAGFAGGHLLDLLAAGAHDIVAWHRPGGHAPRAVRNTRWEAVDLLDRGQVAAAIARLRPSAVYHCAGAAHVGRAWDSTETTFAVNVRGTHHLLDALDRANVEARVLVPSSALVYGSAGEPLTEAHPLAPNSPYAVSKLAQEMLAQRTDGRIQVAIARPFNHVGPRQDPQFAASGFARRIADIELGRWPPEIAVGNLEARRDLTDVRDTVRAYQLILDRGVPGRPYNVCSGRAMPIRELLEMLLARARVPIEVKTDPARYRPNDTPLLVGDPRRVHDELGWTPAIPLEQTLDDLLAYWRSAPQ